MKVIVFDLFKASITLLGGHFVRVSMSHPEKLLGYFIIILIISSVIHPFLVTLFLRNYITNFDETLHTLLGHTNNGFRKVS